MLSDLSHPARAYALAILHQCFVEPKKGILVIGAPNHTQKWASSIPDTPIYAFRHFGRELSSFPYDVDSIFVQEPCAWDEWLSLLPSAKLLIVRHGLPLGAMLKNVQEKIPEEVMANMDRSGSYASLMQRLAKQESPSFPISVQDLESKLSLFGWTYLGELGGYRDFQVSNDWKVRASHCADLRAAATGLLWRESIFVKADPIWNPQVPCSFALRWRYVKCLQNERGWVYTTPEGFVLGVPDPNGLHEIQSWSTLCSKHSQRLRAFLDSGLLDFRWSEIQP